MLMAVPPWPARAPDCSIVVLPMDRAPPCEASRTPLLVRTPPRDTVAPSALLLARFTTEPDGTPPPLSGRRVPSRIGVRPVLGRVPVGWTVVPDPGRRATTAAGVKLPPRLRVPAARSIKPWLVHDAPPKLRLAHV